MAEKRPLPRHTLAKNLKMLCEKSGLSGHEVARRAKVDPKTISNQLNGRYDPRPEQVQAVAEVFGYNAWDLLNPYFNPIAAKNGQLQQLTELYGKSSAEGRDSIMRVAEMAATYKAK